MFLNRDLQFFAKLAIVAAVSTILLKSLAYLLTGSVGLLSDAIESLVNLATALITLYSIKFSQEPEDDRHQFGHSKIEYFSSLTEGFFIIGAGGAIILTGVQRLLNPTEIENVGIGIAVSILASLINACAAFFMYRAAKKFNSIALQADAHHLMTDVYTSAGIVIGVILVSIFNIPMIDPIIAILVGLNIIKTAGGLIYKSFHGLIDESVDEEELVEIRKIITEQIDNKNIQYSLKSRVSGRVKFIYINLSIPDHWNIKETHNLTVIIEKNLKALDTEIRPFIHTEPESDFLHN